MPLFNPFDFTSLLNAFAEGMKAFVMTPARFLLLLTLIAFGWLLHIHIAQLTQELRHCETEKESERKVIIQELRERQKLVDSIQLEASLMKVKQQCIEQQMKQ